MKIIANLFIASVLTLFISCNVKHADSAKVQVLDVNEFEKMVQSASEKIVLDVRTMPEYEQGHLANAMLIDVKQEDFKKRIEKLNKTTPIFVYCAAGIRSEKAANILSEHGFSSIYHLQGGIQAWEKENKQIVKE